MDSLTPVMSTDTPAVTVRERIAHRLERVAGREHLGFELRRLAIDLIGRREVDELDPVSRDLLEREIDRAVAATIEPLLAQFAAELTDRFGALPDELQERLVRAEGRTEIGWD